MSLVRILDLLCVCLSPISDLRLHFFVDVPMQVVPLVCTYSSK